MRQNLHMQTAVVKMDKPNSYIFIGTILGFFVSIFRSFPENTVSWCYRIVCALVGGLILAPATAHICTWLSNYFTWLGFLNASGDSPILPVIYTLGVMFGYPIVEFLHTIKDDLLNLVRNRIIRVNGATTETEN